jgi:membrane protein
MKLQGMSLISRAQDAAEDVQDTVNDVHVPLTRRLGLADLAKQVFAGIGEDHIGAFAGNLAYSGLFSLFPFSIFLLSLLGVFHATSLVNTMVGRLSGTLPDAAITLIKTNVLSVASTRSSGSYSVGAIISILLALWGVSGGFRAIMEATNVVYDVQDTRPFWTRYAISIVLAVVCTVLIIAALVLAVFGPTIGGVVANHFGLGAAFRWTWNIVQWPVLLMFVLAACALIYFMAPDVKQGFRFISPGAIVAVVLWAVFLALFSLYANNFSSYNKTYGALAGLAILLLLMYYSAFILLVGAEINQIIESHAPGGKSRGEHSASNSLGGEGHHEPHTIQILRENRPAPVAPDSADRSEGSARL